ncbi:hypothetical protein AAG906_035440 [Vitis piasezkii]
MSWLYASLSEDIMAQIVWYSTIVEIWNALNQIYFASSMARVTELRTKLQTLKKDGLSTGEYIQRLKSICNSLAVIGELVYEKDHLIYLFNGLDQFSYPAMAHPAGTHNTVPDTNWYMDSGTTHHFTLDINMFDIVTPFSATQISHLCTTKLPSSYSPPILHHLKWDCPFLLARYALILALCLSNATYLINRLSTLLHHQSPYFALYHKLPAYTHLKFLCSFSCLPLPSPPISSSIPHSFPLLLLPLVLVPLVAPTSLPSSSHFVSPSIPPPSPPSPSVDLLVPCSVTEPTSFRQAIKDPSWKQAMELEFATLQHNKTCPVIKPPTIHIVLSLAFSQNWCIRQLDVHNAFLHGDLAEDVFMEQLPGFVDPLYPTHVCKLDKLGGSSHPIGIHLSQAKYMTNLLTWAAMLDAKPCPTPMSSNTNLSLHDGVALENGSDYRSFVGALYLPMTSTSLAIQMSTGLPTLMTGVATVVTASSLALIWFLGHLPNKKWSPAPFTHSDNQLADCMTMPLSTQHFITLRSKLTILIRPMSLRGDVKPKDVIS